MPGLAQHCNKNNIICLLVVRLTFVLSKQNCCELIVRLSEESAQAEY